VRCDGYSAAVVKNHLQARGIETAAKSSLDRHKRHHLTAPGDAEGIVGLALAQGGRQLQHGKIKMSAVAGRFHKTPAGDAPRGPDQGE
jgi:hypothetical protein